jgi:hypothetical protein
MARSRADTRRPPTAPRAAAGILGIALAIGLAVGAISYLSSALAVPGPAERASAAELRERGADVYQTFCGNLAEPRWWPECIGDADEERPRGAEALVTFCSSDVTSRMFTSSDCLSSERPAAALTDAPGPDDVVAGAVGVAAALAVLGAWAAARRLRHSPVLGT